jgi:hypothetical protein
VNSRVIFDQKNDVSGTGSVSIVRVDVNFCKPSLRKAGFILNFILIRRGSFEFYINTTAAFEF